METVSADEVRRRMLAGEPLRALEVTEDVSVAGPLVFPRWVVCASVKFLGSVRFSDVQFAEPAQFTGCTFTRGAVMFNSRFAGTDFSGSRFCGTAYFWRSTFAGPARFDDVVVSRDASAPGSIDSGELNLCWARFEGPASLVRARIHGPARFWRTIFRSDVTMDEALFGAGVSMMGLRHEVSIDLLPLGALSAFKILDRAHLLRPDPESMMQVAGARFPRFAQLTVDSAAALDAAIERETIPDGLGSALRQAFRDGAHPMFDPRKRASLCRIEIPTPQKVELRDVDMRSCRLLGTPLAGAQLVDVHWPTKRFLLGTARRNATADEDAPLDRSGRAELRRLYRELASTYETQLDATQASRFRVAEREVARLDLSWAARALATLQRQLSVYGESPGVALFWLAVFTLLVFPLLFASAARFEGAAAGAPGAAPTLLAAVVRSLEVSAFLESGEAVESLPSRLVAGIERIVVTAQAALFLLSLRRLAPTKSP